MKCSNKGTGVMVQERSRRIRLTLSAGHKRTYERKIKRVVATNTICRSKARNQLFAIIGTGATGHFMILGIPVINMKPTNNPIIVILPDG